jgi:excisionase family DNA binding protein
MSTLTTPELATPKEAQQFLRISHSTLYALIRQRRIPVVKIGRSCRIRWETLRNFIAENTK